MKSDKMLVAGLCGVIAVILHEIFGRILIFFGIGKYSVFQLSSFVITIDRPSGTIGLVTASLVAITIALLYYVALKISGFNYVMIKGIFAGLFGWVFCELIYTWLVEGPGLIPLRPMSDYYLQIGGAGVFGLILGFLFQKFIVAPEKSRNKGNI